MKRSVKVIYIILFQVFIFQAAMFASENGAAKQKIGIDEKLGAAIPQDLVYTDENGKPFRFSELNGKPVVLALVYYRCPNICSPLLLGMAEVIDRLDLKPGEDYNAVALSFDERETPETAKRWKNEHLSSMKKEIPENSWRFLTGDSINIRKLTDAAGFYFKRDTNNNFAHMASLIILSPKGKVTRYIFGTTFLQTDLKMAIEKAKMEQSTPTINKLLAFCYSYDRKGDRYFFDITKTVGIISLLTVSVFFAVLMLKGRKNKISKG